MFYKTRYVIHYNVVKGPTYGQTNHVFPHTFTFKAKNDQAAMRAVEGKWKDVTKIACRQTRAVAVEFAALVKEKKEVLFGWSQDSTVLPVSGLRNTAVVNSK